VIVMLVHFILGIVGMLSGAFVGGLLLVILGIRRGDSGKRLTGKPASGVEVLARRVLTGSRGCDSRDDAEDGR
jgi:hypothetical protein